MGLISLVRSALQSDRDPGSPPGPEGSALSLSRVSPRSESTGPVLLEADSSRDRSRPRTATAGIDPLEKKTTVCDRSHSGS